ncbi:MAG: sigma-70 family RNA polymerase sigma factor [Oscillospiraceae bacterium]|nr:sigma-70 family RNA polymerase sigma factor [Oscillospiraceae bacterium]
MGRRYIFTFLATVTPMGTISTSRRCLTVARTVLTGQRVRIANEVLMFFRSQKKLQGEVSLSETLETDKDGNNLFLMDVVGVEDTMLDDLDMRESHIRVRRLVDECLTEREADIIRKRYGLGGRKPQTQRELAAEYGISRSYVSRIEKRALGKLEEALGKEMG